ncbi:MAG: hypothetical protein ACJ0DF_03420 [Paracoccaceae bacterium]
MEPFPMEMLESLKALETKRPLAFESLLEGQAEALTQTAISNAL